MLDGVYHPANLRHIGVCHGLAQRIKAERLESALLIFTVADRAFHPLNGDCFQNGSSFVCHELGFSRAAGIGIDRGCGLAGDKRRYGLPAPAALLRYVLKAH